MESRPPETETICFRSAISSIPGGAYFFGTHQSIVFIVSPLYSINTRRLGMNLRIVTVSPLGTLAPNVLFHLSHRKFRVFIVSFPGGAGCIPLASPAHFEGETPFDGFWH